MEKGTIIAISGVVVAAFAGVASLVMKHSDGKPEAPQAATHEQKLPERLPFTPPADTANTVVAEQEPVEQGPSQEELDEQLVRAIYDLRAKAVAACKTPGIADAGLSATLALNLFVAESPRMQSELQALDIQQLSSDDLSLKDAAVGEKDFWTFLQDNKIIPLVEYTKDRTQGIAYVNTGSQKALVFYASQQKDEDGKVGTYFNAANDGVGDFLAALGEEGALKANGILLHFDDSRIGDGAWKVHSFKAGDKPYELLPGVRQTLVLPPRNPCAAAPQ